MNKREKRQIGWLALWTVATAFFLAKSLIVGDPAGWVALWGVLLGALIGFLIDEYAEYRKRVLIERIRSKP